MQKHIAFTILFITFKGLNGLSPKYLTDLLVLHQLNRHLRSDATDNLRLYRPVLKTKNYGGRETMLWNDPSGTLIFFKTSSLCIINHCRGFTGSQIVTIFCKSIEILL